MRTYIKENATKLLFMAAVFSFLGVSIPKVAYVFHMYEPQSNGFFGLMWWVFAVLAAAGIDILAGYLTLVMMNKEARNRGDKFTIWVFIITLMGYSWYCNWLFDMKNSPHPIDFWSMGLINLPYFGKWTVDQLTPIIVAALPVFIVAYASIAHLVHVKVAPISLEELQQKATEAQARAEAQVAIMKAQNMVNEEKAVGVIGVGKKVLKSALNGSANSVRNQDELPADFVLTTPRNSEELDPSVLSNLDEISGEFGADFERNSGNTPDEINTPDEMPAISAESSPQMVGPH
jgi:hypothetical protein